MALPLEGLVVDGQPLEQIAIPQKNLLERRERQRLAETPRPRQEVHPLRRLNELPDQLRLVDVQEAALDEVAERVHAGRDRLEHSYEYTLPDDRRQ